MPAAISLRRIIILVVLAAAGGALVAWLRDRGAPPVPPNPPQWPPLTPTDIAAWRSPDTDGSCPAGFPVKVKESSGIFHVPGGTFYDRTNPDRCYVDAAAAAADGYRRSKS